MCGSDALQRNPSSSTRVPRENDSQRLVHRWAVAAARLSTGTQDRPYPRADTGYVTTPVPRKTTTAFFAQAGLSFGVAVLAMGWAIVYLPVEPWIRAFLGLGTLYVVTSAFTLAKCVRDQQEDATVVSRVEQARLDKLLIEHDRFKVPAG